MRKKVPRPKGLKCPRCGKRNIHSYGDQWYCLNCGKKWVKNPSLMKVPRDSKGRFIQGFHWLSILRKGKHASPGTEWKKNDPRLLGNQFGLKATKAAEGQINQLKSQGFTQEEIAGKLGISARTVRRHLSGRIKAKR